MSRSRSDYYMLDWPSEMQEISFLASLKMRFIVPYLGGRVSTIVVDH
jgi:hypothetical protein